MELSTAPSLVKTTTKFLKIDETGHAVPVFFTFLSRGAGNEESKIIANATNFLASNPYVLREYSGTSPFADNNQSAYNLIGSFRESLEADVKLRIWNDLSAAGLNMDFALTCAEQSQGDNIPVAYDGVIFTLAPVLKFGPNHRENCDTCQSGLNLLRHALLELRNKVCYNLDTLRDGNYHYGDNAILDTDGMCYVDSPRDADGNKIREFINWFMVTHEGPLTMADIELSFKIGN